jgi:hypothetical protein
LVLAGIGYGTSHSGTEQDGNCTIVWVDFCPPRPLLGMVGLPASSRYFFVIQTPSQRYPDDGGQQLPDEETAFAHATALIEELKSDDEDYRGWSMIVQDSAGRTVFSIPF